MGKDEQLKLQKSLARASDRTQLIKSGAALSPFLSGVPLYFITKAVPNLVPPWSITAWILWVALIAAIYLGIEKWANKTYVDTTD